MSLPVIKVVIIEPDHASRKIYRLLFRELGKQLGTSVKTYASDNSVEGLGYIVITKPDVVIMNIRLPGSSGEELVDHLNENIDTYQGIALMQIMVLYEFDDEAVINRLNSNFTAINKNNKGFLKDFFRFLWLNLHYRLSGELEKVDGDISWYKRFRSFIFFHCMSCAMHYEADALSLNQKAASEILFYRYLLIIWIALRRLLAWGYTLCIQCTLFDFSSEYNSSGTIKIYDK